MASPESRPTVLIAIDWYLPAFRAGGPIRSIANLVAALGDDIDFRIVCGDRDLGASEPLPVDLDTWHTIGKALVLYLPKADWTAARWTERGFGFIKPDDGSEARARNSAQF